MAWKKWTFRVVRVGGLAALALVLLTFAAVQIQQWVLRWRAERLMADMHRIRLYQSTWADAQALMHRWGAWGHYDGTCTAENCRYEVTLGRLWAYEEPSHESWIGKYLGVVRASGLLGGRLSLLDARITVQDGFIWRTEANVGVDVPGGLRSAGEPNADYLLLINTRSRDRLHQSARSSEWSGGDDQLSDHPNYKFRHPSGCENCFAAFVTYSTHTPPTDIDRLTDFDFSCFTRFRNCQWLGDFLPLAWDWRLYSRFEPGHTLQMEVPQPPRSCDIPLWALGRDYNTVVAVQSLSTAEKRQADGGLQEADRARIDSTLKGAQWRNGLALDTFPFQEDPEDPSLGISEHLTPGKRYLLLYEDPFDDPPGPWLNLDRCGVWDDNPANRRELQKGFAQNDNLRGPERW